MNFCGNWKCLVGNWCGVLVRMNLVIMWWFVWVMFWLCYVLFICFGFGVWVMLRCRKWYKLGGLLLSGWIEGVGVILSVE